MTKFAAYGDIAVQDRLISIDWSLGRLAPVAEYRHDPSRITVHRWH
jgi:hypothetical protein